MYKRDFALVRRLMVFYNAFASQCIEFQAYGIRDDARVYFEAYISTSLDQHHFIGNFKFGIQSTFFKNWAAWLAMVRW